MVFQSMSSIVAGLIIGFIFSWELSLLIVAIAPLMVISGFIEMRIVMGVSQNDKEALNAAGKVIVLKHWVWACNVTEGKGTKDKM